MWRKIIFVFTIIKSTHLIINVCRIWELTKYAMLLLLLLLLLDSLNAVISCFLGTKGFCKSKARVIWGRGCCTNPLAKKHREKTPTHQSQLFMIGKNQYLKGVIGGNLVLGNHVGISLCDIQWWRDWCRNVYWACDNGKMMTLWVFGLHPRPPRQPL